MPTRYGLQVEGLRESVKALSKLGVPDDAIKDAIREGGLILQREAWRIMPVKSGAMAHSLKVSKAKSKLEVYVGDNKKVKYALNFHAQAMGLSKGGYTFTMTHRGGPKNGQHYKKQRRIPNNPFMFTAFDRKVNDVEAAFVDAIDKLIRGVDDG